MNKVFLIGNLTRDPELSNTASGVSLCRFSIAVSRPYTQGDGEKKTDFFNCTVWRGMAENVAKYCKKGNKVAIEGSVQIRTYEDNNGQQRTAVDVICSNVEFLSQKSTAAGDTTEQNRGTGKKIAQLEAFEDDDDCPF